MFAGGLLLRTAILIILGAWPATASFSDRDGAVPPETALFGKVFDQATGEPLRKVRIAVQGTQLVTVTDDDGAYRLQGIPAGRQTVHVSTIGYRLIRRDLQLAEGEEQEVLFYLGQEASTINETIRVTAPVFEDVEKAATSQVTLNSSELKNLAGVLIDDPMRSVQTLPGVAAGDDFHSFYSVRGGNFQNNGVVVDGVFTHNIVHTIQGTAEPTGSVMLMNGDLVESMALYTGAFSAKYGDRTASFLDVITREGSRDKRHARVAVSGSNAAFVAEGPTASRRGSWILSARKSYADYLIRRIGTESDLVLGFGDVQGRLHYDVSDHQEFGAGLIWGRTHLGRNPANRGVTSLIDGVSNVGIINLNWNWIPDPRLFWENRLYLARESFQNENKYREVMDRGEYTELAVRSDVSFRIPGRHRVESGLLVRFVENRLLDRRYDYSLGQFLDYDSMRGRYRHTSAYVQDRWELVLGRLTATLGARAESTELNGQTTLNPRAQIEWRPVEKTRIDAGWGIFTQFPEILPVLGRNGDSRLRAEVARHHVLGFERLVGDKTRVRLELYDKEESDLVRSRDNLFRLVDGKVTSPDFNFRYDNALRGYTRGFEVFLQRRSANRLAGWISYAYGRSRRHDLVTGDRYPSEFEQVHTANIYSSYRFSEKWNLSVKSRFGSGFPYPGYYEERGPDLYLTTARNEARLPFYARIDFRLNRASYFTWGKLSLYLELLNVMNRGNERFEQVSSVNGTTRRVSFRNDFLMPILPTAGFTIEF